MVLKVLAQIVSDLAALAARQISQSSALARIEAKLDAQGVLLAAITESVVASPATSLELSIFVGGEKQGANYMPILHAGDKYTVTVAPKNAAGNAAPIDGPVTFTATPVDAVDIVVDATGLSATITGKSITGAALATFSVEASADADLGPGVRKIVGVSTGSVVPADLEATVLELVESPVTPVV